MSERIRFGQWPGGCYYCGCPMTEHDPTSPRAKTSDHKTPRSRGGKGLANRAFSCRECNGEKSNLTVAEYGAWIKAGRPPMYAFKWTILYFRSRYERHGAKPPAAILALAEGKEG